MSDADQHLDAGRTGIMDQILTNLFEMSEPWPEKVIRSVAVYLFLFIALRLAGKRELGNVSTGDLIVVLLLSNTVQNAIIGDETSLIGGLAGAAILIVLNKAIVFASYHNRQFRRMVDGEPVELIVDGKVDETALTREKLTQDELAMAVREQNVAGFAGVKRAVLETNGIISVIPSSDGERETIVDRLARIEAALNYLIQGSNPEPATRK
jgi:uncharacterized membrane protein YcaP (DUF421 family)